MKTIAENSRQNRILYFSKMGQEMAFLKVTLRPSLRLPAWYYFFVIYMRWFSHYSVVCYSHSFIIFACFYQVAKWSTKMSHQSDWVTCLCFYFNGCPSLGLVLLSSGWRATGKLQWPGVNREWSMEGIWRILGLKKAAWWLWLTLQSSNTVPANLHGGEELKSRIENLLAIR